jgi:hypothetical protein
MAGVFRTMPAPNRRSVVEVSRHCDSLFFGRWRRGTYDPIHCQAFESPHVVIDDLRKNEFQGREDEVFESLEVSGPADPLVLRLFSNELRRLWLLPLLLLLLLLESILVLDLELSLL